MFKEHHRHIRLYHPDKSTVADHSINLGYPIHFQNTSIQAKKSGLMELIIREEIKVDLLSNNINRDEIFPLSKSWNSLLQNLKERKKDLSKEKTLRIDSTNRPSQNQLFSGPHCCCEGNISHHS
jgi:hypothetical protein